MSYGRPASKPHHDGEIYTQEEIQRAIALKDQGLTWPVIGRRLGRAPDALSTTIGRYLKGQKKFAKAAKAAETEEIAREIIAGSSLSAAARRRGLYPSGVHQRLARMGWDQDTLMEARQEIAA